MFFFNFVPFQNKWTVFDLQSVYQHPVHCNNFSSWLKAMIECWNFLNSKLWGLVRCRKKRISALEIGIWDEPWKFPMHLCSAIFTPSNLSYLSALTRRCRLFTSTRESKEGVTKTTKSSLWLEHTSHNYWWYLCISPAPNHCLHLSWKI